MFGVAEVFCLACGDAFAGWSEAYHPEIVVDHDLYKLRKGDARRPSELPARLCDVCLEEIHLCGTEITGVDFDNDGTWLEVGG